MLDRHLAPALFSRPPRSRRYRLCRRPCRPTYCIDSGGIGPPLPGSGAGVHAVHLGDAFDVLGNPLRRWFAALPLHAHRRPGGLERGRSREFVRLTCRVRVEWCPRGRRPALMDHECRRVVVVLGLKNAEPRPSVDTIVFPDSCPIPLRFVGVIVSVRFGLVRFGSAFNPRPSQRPRRLHL